MAGHDEKPIPLFKVDQLEITNAKLVLNGVTPNGTSDVTISNVAPSGVGTATISAWMQIKAPNSGGIAYYIPLWT